MIEKTFFKDKYCKLVTDNGYVIWGTVLEVDEIGFLFDTDNKKAFFNWNKITSIMDLSKGDF